MTKKVGGRKQMRVDGFSASVPTCVILVKLSVITFLMFLKTVLLCFASGETQVNSPLSSVDGLMLTKL